MNIVIDPVCGMEIDAASAAASAKHEGETYYFCAESCRAAFEGAPERYAGRGEEEEACGGPVTCGCR